MTFRLLNRLILVLGFLSIVISAEALTFPDAERIPGSSRQMPVFRKQYLRVNEPSARQISPGQTAPLAFGASARSAGLSAPDRFVRQSPLARKPSAVAADTRPVQPVQSPVADGFDHGGYDAVRSKDYQNNILSNYGFTKQSAAYLKDVSFKVANVPWDEDGTDAHWHPDIQQIHLSGYWDPSAVHELAHAWYDANDGKNRWGSEIAAATVMLANINPAWNPQFAVAIKIAEEYVGYGWADPSSSEFKPHEIYAKFACLTMGDYKEGVNQLPQFMWKFYDSLFNGDPKVTYYK